MSLRTRVEAAHAILNTSASGATVIVSAVAGQRVGVYRLIIENPAGTANTITFQDTASGALSAPYTLPANGFLILDTPINNDPWWQTGLSLGLQINLSANTQIVGDIWFLQTV